MAANSAGGGRSDGGGISAPDHRDAAAAATHHAAEHDAPHAAVHTHEPLVHCLADAGDASPRGGNSAGSSVPPLSLLSPPAGGDAAGGGTPTPAQAVEFLMAVGHLKSEKRQGWLRCGVKSPESISDHMYRMAIAAMMVRSPDVQPLKAACIALAHDMAEALVGDITPHDGIGKADKHAREAAAIDSMMRMLGADTHIAAQLRGWYEEYENAASPEARLVKDIDKFEMILQAYEYETRQSTFTSSQQFFDSVAGAIAHPTVRAWEAELVRRRNVWHNRRSSYSLKISIREAAGMKSGESGSASSAASARHHVDAAAAGGAAAAAARPHATLLGPIAETSGSSPAREEGSASPDAEGGQAFARGMSIFLFGLALGLAVNLTLSRR